MSDELREELERQRRAAIHRQIGALENALTLLEQRKAPGTWLRTLKIRQKIDRLHHKLNQRMLLKV